MLVIPRQPPNEWRAEIDGQSDEVCTPSIRRGHRWKLPDEDHDPVLDTGRFLVP
jgi:hypothetical protein